MADIPLGGSINNECGSSGFGWYGEVRLSMIFCILLIAYLFSWTLFFVRTGRKGWGFFLTVAKEKSEL